MNTANLIPGKWYSDAQGTLWQFKKMVGDVPILHQEGNPTTQYAFSDPRDVDALVEQT